jgi:hypothetical protein
VFETVSSDIITAALDGYNGKYYCNGRLNEAFNHLNVCFD